MEDVMMAKLAIVLEQAGAHLLSGLRPFHSEPEGQHEFSGAGVEVDLSGAGEIAIFRALIFPLHLEMSREVLPSVGHAHEPDGHLLPGSGASQGQSGTVALGEEQGQTFVIADPASIVVPGVGEVGREQGVKVIIGELSLQRFETDFLQQDVAVRIGENFLVDAVAGADFGVDQFESRDAGFEGTALESAVAFLLRKERLAIGDQEAEVASAGLVDPREVHFI